MSQQIASVYAKIGADTSGLDRGLSSTKSKLGGVAGTLGKVAAGATAALGVAFVAAAKKSASVAADFESQMNTLTIAARSSGTSMDDLSAAAIAVGGDTRLVGINASESAAAMEDFYKAGLTTADIFGDLNGYMTGNVELSGALRAAVDLQAASEMDLAQASDAVSIAMATFGLEAENATAIADSFVRTADASVASVTELSQSMVNVGPTAASFGWELQDVNTALGILSERGIKGSVAGNGLKSMMLNLTRQTPDVKEALDQLGVSLYDVEGNMKSLPDILGQIEAGMAGMTEEQQQSIKATLAGSFGISAMNSLLDEGVEGWKAMEKAIAEAASAQEVAAARTKGFHAAMETLNGVVETFMIMVGTPLIQKVLTPLVKQLTAGVEAAMHLKTNFSGLGDIFSTSAAGMLSALEALQNLGLSANQSVSVFMFLRDAVKQIGPFIEEFGIIWDMVWTGVRDIAKSVWNDVGPFIMEMAQKVTAFFQEKFQTVLDWFVLNLPLIKQTVTTVLNAVQDIWTTVWPFIAGFVLTTWENIKMLISAAINTVLGVIKAVMQAINGDWAGAWETIKGVAVTIWETIKKVIDNTLIFIVQVISVIWMKVQPKLAEAWEAIKTKAEEVWAALKVKAAEIWTSIKDSIQDNVDKAKDKAREAWESIKAKTNEAFDAIKAKVRTAIQSVVDTIAGLPGKLAGLAAQFYDQAVALGKNIASGISDGISGFVTQAKAAAVGTVQDAWKAAKDWAGIRSPSKKFAELGRSMVEGLAVGAWSAEGLLSKAFERIGQGTANMIEESWGDMAQYFDVPQDAAFQFQDVLYKLGLRAEKTFKKIQSEGKPVLPFMQKLALAGRDLLRAFEWVGAGKASNIDSWHEIAGGFGATEKEMDRVGSKLYQIGTKANVTTKKTSAVQWPGGGDLFDFVKRNNESPYLRNLEHSLQSIRAQGLSKGQYTMYEDMSMRPVASRSTAAAVKIDMNINGSTLDTREERLQVVRRLERELQEVMARG